MTTSQASDIPQPLANTADILALGHTSSDSSPSLTAFAEVYGMAAGGSSLASKPTESKAHSVLHDISISNSHGVMDFLHGAGQSFAYSLVQSPLEGLAQTFDHTIGVAGHTNLYDQVKNRLVEAPKPAAFGSAEWHGQAIGGALAIIPWFLATRSALRGAASLAPETAGLVVSDAEAAAGHDLFSATSGKLILESGTTAAVYSTAFKPVGSGEKNYWQAKSDQTATDFATFSTLTASSIFLSNGLRAATLPMLEKYPGASQLVQKGSAVLAGTLSGIPAAAVQTVGAYAHSGRISDLSLSNFGKNAYSFAVVGASLSVGPAMFAPTAKMQTTGNEAPDAPLMPPALMPSSPLTHSEGLAMAKAGLQAFGGKGQPLPPMQLDGYKFVPSTWKSPLAGLNGKSIGKASGSENQVVIGKINGAFGTNDNNPNAGLIQAHNVAPIQSAMKPAISEIVAASQQKHFAPWHANENTETDSSQGSRTKDWGEIARTSDVARQLPDIPNAYGFKSLLSWRSIGKLPQPFSETGLQPEAVFGKLDSLAKALRVLDGSSPLAKKSGAGTTDLELKPFNIDIGSKQVTVSKIGSGEVAHVYKLSIDNQDYAFKVPTDPARMDVHGSYFETGAFVHLSKEKISDLIDFHAANPGPQGGWMLTEFVSKPVTRSGRPLADVLFEQNQVLGDDWGPNRGPGNVVWDLGGIEPQYVKKPTTLDGFYDLVNTRSGQQIAARKLGNIKDQDDLKEALIRSLDSPSIRGQVARTAARNLTNQADLAQVLDLALDTEGGAGRAAFELDRLANTPYITELFYKALKSDESRLEAVKQIDKLPPEDRKEAFDAAFAFPDARAMAARSIDSIPDESDRLNAAAKASQYPGSSFVLLQALSKVRPLTDSEQSAQQGAFEEHLDNFGLATGSNLAAAGKTLSFAQFFNNQKSLSDTETIGPYSAYLVGRIWDQLNAKQKEMSPESLLSLSESWGKLDPLQWRSMNAKQTQEHLALIKGLALDDGLSREFFAHPDFEDWLRKNPPEDRYAAVQVLDIWNRLLPGFKKFDGDRLYNVAPVWDYLTIDQWEKLPEQYFDDTLKTIRSLGLWSMGTRDLVKSPDFAKWFSDNNPQTYASTEQLTTTLRVWDKLTPEQKNLPAREVIEQANMLAFKDYLETVLDKDSPAFNYLVSLAKPLDSPLPQAAEWLNVMSLAESNEIKTQAKNFVEKLAQDKAPAEAFSRESLDNQFYLGKLWQDNPAFQARLKQVFPDDHSMSNLVSFVRGDEEMIKPLIEQAIERGYTNSDRQFAKLEATASILTYLDAGTAPLQTLLRLQQQGLHLEELATYIEENPNSAGRINSLLASNADANQLSAKNLADQDELTKLQGFLDSELSQLDALQHNGLSVTRLSYHLKDNPKDVTAIHELLAKGADAKQINDFLRLAVFPSDVNLKLVAAIKKGDIKTEDVLGKLRNWHSGRQFRDLLISQVNSDATLSKARLDIIQSKAATLADTEPATTASPSNRGALPRPKDAESFVDTARNIEKKIPADKPIVLLGRDAWPLLPILRQAGRDVHYFLWSRLQYNDAVTKDQWLKEIPPNAAVIDTGFSGSIIDQIKTIDPEITGYLMSSTNDEKYPTLLSFPDHRSRVTSIETSPKLIYRSSKHTEQGGAVSRRDPNSEDNDTTRSIGGRSRWNAERHSRELLRASGLPAWDVWRYSQFVGLTPMERLGFDTTDQLAQHYDAIAQARSESGHPL